MFHGIVGGPLSSVVTPTVIGLSTTKPSDDSSISRGKLQIKLTNIRLKLCHIQNKFVTLTLKLAGDDFEDLKLVIRYF